MEYNVTKKMLPMLSCLMAMACTDVKPQLSGRLSRPVAMAAFKGCPQEEPGCMADAAHHLLLVANLLSDDLRIFDMEEHRFFTSNNPLMPFRIPVGPHPTALAVDPNGEFAFVANQLGRDVSLVDLKKMVEMDTDGNPLPSTAAKSLECCSPSDESEGKCAQSDRCRAGVSRVELGGELGFEPEAVVAPPPLDPANPWDRNTPLPVYVSVPAAGKIARLEFTYPDAALAREAGLGSKEDYAFGGTPSGLVLNKSGSMLFAADESESSILWIETATGNHGRIEVGGPTRRVAIAPDGTLYALRLDTNRIALVNASINPPARIPAGEPALPTAKNPEGDGMDIVLPGIPREITFVKGQKILVGDVPYPGIDPETQKPLPPITQFAFVSNLNGNVYIVDAVNHHGIDFFPTSGPLAASPGLVLPGKKALTAQSPEIVGCIAKPAECPYPIFADIGLTFDNNTVKEPIYNGIWVRNGITMTDKIDLKWEGVIQGAGPFPSGRFAGWDLRDSTDPSRAFLSVGVQPGDILEILSDNANACADNKIKEFLIESISDVVIEETPTQVLALTPVDGVQPGVCWPEAVIYQVRAKQAWTVVGTKAGSLPRLTTMVPFEPPEDPAAPRTPKYNTPTFALTMFAPAADSQGNPTPVARDTLWTFSLNSEYLDLAFQPYIRYQAAGALLPIDMDDGKKAEEEEAIDDRVYLLFEGSNLLLEFYPGMIESTNYVPFE